jgi:hypothetical protein
MGLRGASALLRGSYRFCQTFPSPPGHHSDGGE